MEYKDLQAVNSTLNVMPIKGKDYITVNERIKAFRQLYPEGTIETEILSMSNGVVTMKATVKDTEVVLGTGHAQEKESSSYINKTSYIENCETSAVGRALGMLGIGIDTSFASYEEVANAQLNQDKGSDKKPAKNEDVKQAKKPESNPEKEAQSDEKIKDAQVKAIEKMCEENGIVPAYITYCYQAETMQELTTSQYLEIVYTMSKEDGVARLREAYERWQSTKAS